MDSRLRGNDGDGSGNDGGECGIDVVDEGGNDGGECRIDGDGCRLRGCPSPRRRQAAVQSLQTSQTQFLQVKLRVMVGRPMMSSKEKANFFLRFVLKSIRLQAAPIPIPIAAAPYNIFRILLK